MAIIDRYAHYRHEGPVPPPLSERHAHPRDKRVRFFDDHGQHEYCIYDKEGRPKDGNRGPGCTYSSVTTICHHGFSTFDGLEIAKKIEAKCRPGSYYYGCKAHEISAASCPDHPQANVVVDPKSGRLRCPEGGKQCPIQETGIWPFVRDAGTIMHEVAEDYYNGRWTVEDLARQEAKDQNDFSRPFQDHFRQFTDAFPHLEKYYNGRWTRAQLDAGTTSLVPPEVEHLLRFIGDHPHLEPYRTEWFVFDEDLRAVGAIDMLFWDAHLQQYCIYDWKRARQLRTRNWEGNTGATWWSDHLVDCNVQHYRLQLCTYKLILERNYGMRIAEMWLVRCHPDARNYQKVQVHWDQAMMTNFVAARAAEVIGLPEAPYREAGYVPAPVE